MVVIVIVIVVEPVIVAALVIGNDTVVVIDTVNEGATAGGRRPISWTCCTSRSSMSISARSNSSC